MAHRMACALSRTKQRLPQERQLDYLLQKSPSLPWPDLLPLKFHSVAWITQPPNSIAKWNFILGWMPTEVIQFAINFSREEFINMNKFDRWGTILLTTCNETTLFFMQKTSYVHNETGMRDYSTLKRAHNIMRNRIRWKLMEADVN